MNGDWLQGWGYALECIDEALNSTQFSGQEPIVLAQRIKIQ
jgi:hypothetical protein